MVMSRFGLMSFTFLCSSSHTTALRLNLAQASNGNCYQYCPLDPNVCSGLGVGYDVILDGMSSCADPFAPCFETTVTGGHRQVGTEIVTIFGGGTQLKGCGSCDKIRALAKLEQGVSVVSCTETGGSLTVGAENDPTITNMAGKKYFLGQTGMFSLLRAADKRTSQELLSLQASIVEATHPYPTMSKDPCAPAYIEKISLQGAWVREGGKMNYDSNEPLPTTSEIQVRARPWLPKEQALEIGFDNQWRKAAQPFNYSYIKAQKGKWAETTISLHELKIVVQLVTLSSNVPWEKPYKGYNYLNVHIKGTQESKQRLDFTGLLAFDSVNQNLPLGCSKSGKPELQELGREVLEETNHRTFSEVTIM